MSEVQAEGVTTLVDTQVVNLGTQPTTLSLKETAPPVIGLPHQSFTKNQSDGPNQKFFKFTTLDVGNKPDLAWKRVEINPLKDFKGAAGEAIKLPFQRNVWFSGNMDNGYMTTLIVQLVATRPPQVSGIIEIRDCARTISSIYHLNFGGRVEIPIMPVKFALPFPSMPRTYLTPKLKTATDAVFAFQWRLVAYNRTSDTKNVFLDVQVRLGNTTFYGPKKPRPPPVKHALSGVFDELIDSV